MGKIEIIIPFKTPSVNHLYFSWRNRKILTKEARELKKLIKKLVDSQMEFKIMCDDVKLSVNVEIYENWMCKNGEVSKKDISNREKFLIDAVFDSLGIDDKYIYQESFKKIQSLEEEKAIITIENEN